MAIVSVEEWLAGIPNKRSRRGCHSALLGPHGFFTVLGLKDVELVAKIKKVKDNEKRHEIFEPLIRKWLLQLNEPDPDVTGKQIVNGKSRNYYFTVVKQYLDTNFITFNKDRAKKIKNSLIKIDEGYSDEVPEDIEPFKKILHRLPTRFKAFYLCKLSTMCRITELLMVKRTDVNLETGEVLLRGSTTKNGMTMTKILTDEALFYLKEWVKELDSLNMSTIVHRAYNLHKIGPEKEQEMLADYRSRIFPFSASTAREALHRASKKAGYYKVNPITNRATIHPHTFRKYSKTIMSEFNDEFAEAYIGHKDKLKKVYNRHGPKKLLKHIKDHQEAIEVFGDGKTVAELKEEKRKLTDAHMSDVAERKRLEAQVNLQQRRLETQPKTKDYEELSRRHKILEATLALVMHKVGITDEEVQKHYESAVREYYEG